jgi:hypothetical protein
MTTVFPMEYVAVNVLEEALQGTWSRRTSADPNGWREDNAAWGQCAVTALIVQDYFGGSLRRGEVGAISHYWNLLPSGQETDLTIKQFPEGTKVVNATTQTREYVLSHLETARRYRRLARRVDQRLRGGMLALS